MSVLILLSRDAELTSSLVVCSYEPCYGSYNGLYLGAYVVCRRTSKREFNHIILKPLKLGFGRFFYDLSCFGLNALLNVFDWHNKLNINQCTLIKYNICLKV